MTIPVFEGIITVVTTPFDGSGAIDLDVLGRHLDWLIAQGVHAILPGGTTGEYQAQSLSERRHHGVGVCGSTCSIVSVSYFTGSLLS